MEGGLGDIYTFMYKSHKSKNYVSVGAGVCRHNQLQ